MKGFRKLRQTQACGAGKRVEWRRLVGDRCGKRPGEGLSRRERRWGAGATERCDTTTNG